MKLKRLLLTVAAIGVTAVQCNPAPNGYALYGGVSGSAKNIAFWVDGNDANLLYTTAAILNEINRFTGSQHHVTTSDPGAITARAQVIRVPNVAEWCSGSAETAGCALRNSVSVEGTVYAAGGVIYVQTQGDQGSFNFLVAHEIGHILGLEHFDGIIKDSSGLDTTQTMCYQIYGCGPQLVYADGADFYAEGDIRGLQARANSGRIL